MLHINFHYHSKRNVRDGYACTSPSFLSKDGFSSRQPSWSNFVVGPCIVGLYSMLPLILWSTMMPLPTSLSLLSTLPWLCLVALQWLWDHGSKEMDRVEESFLVPPCSSLESLLLPFLFTNLPLLVFTLAMEFSVGKLISLHFFFFFLFLIFFSSFFRDVFILFSLSHHFFLFRYGLGLNYICPVSALQKWFPDYRGLASGLFIFFPFWAYITLK